MTRANTGKLTMKAGSTYKLGVKAPGAKLTYKSSKPGVVKVSKGKLKAIKTGSATISIVAKKGSQKTTAKVKVKVVAKKKFKKVKSITAKASSTNLKVGGTAKIKVTFKPGKASNKNLLYTSSNTKVLTVSENGSVKAVGAGTASIKVTSADNKKASKKVTFTVTKPKTVTYYTVSFDSNGGSYVDSQSVAAGKKATMPKAPSLYGSTFVGWYTDSALTQSYDFGKPVRSNLTLYALWRSSDIDDGIIDLGDLQTKEDNGDITVVYGDNGRSPRTINGTFTDDKVTTADDAANVLTSAAPLFSEDSDYFAVDADRIVADTVDDIGERTFRYEPMVNGREVEGSQIIISANADGTVTGLNSTYDSNIENCWDQYEYDDDLAWRSDEVSALVRGYLADEFSLDEDTIAQAYDFEVERVLYAGPEVSSPTWVCKVFVTNTSLGDDIDYSQTDSGQTDDEVEDLELSDSSSDEGEGDPSTEALAPVNRVYYIDDDDTTIMVIDYTNDITQQDDEDLTALAEEDGDTSDTSEDATEEATVAPKEPADSSVDEDAVIDEDPTTDAVDQETLPEAVEEAPAEATESEDGPADEDSEPMLSARASGGSWSNKRFSIARDLNGNPRTFYAQENGSGNRRLRDGLRNLETYKVTYSGALFWRHPQYPGDLVTFTNEVGQIAATAHANMSEVYDYYKNVLDRDSYSGIGSTIKVSYGEENLYNAYWSSSKQQMVYGDQGNFPACLDVAGHEFTHAVINYVVGNGGSRTLTYQNESGALNEAYADVFGMLIEGKTGRDKWLLAEDSDATIRSMANPEAYGDVSHYSNRYTGSDDNGGVHTNSGIFNNAVYRMMTDSRTSGIGDEMWARVFYGSLHRLTCDASFLDARGAVLGAANVRGFSDDQLAAIKDAFDAVGVTNPNTIRIVLRWGTTPSDLDSHLTGPGTYEDARFHTWYEDKIHSDMYGNFIADLDRDDTDSYGPEITTIHKGYRGTYHFYVHDYTNGDSLTSTDMARSRATVTVYHGGHILASMQIDPGSMGTYWHVFDLEIGDGIVRYMPRNRYGDSSLAESLY